MLHRHKLCFKLNKQAMHWMAVQRVTLKVRRKKKRSCLNKGAVFGEGLFTSCQFCSIIQPTDWYSSKTPQLHYTLGGSFDLEQGQYHDSCLGRFCEEEHMFSKLTRGKDCLQKFHYAFKVHANTFLSSASVKLASWKWIALP